MIKRITLPSTAEIDRMRESAPPRSTPSLIARNTGREVTLPNQAYLDHEAAIASLEKRIKEAEAELETLLDEGYTVIAATPFKEGEGENLVLRKSDSRYMTPQMAEDLINAINRYVEVGERFSQHYAKWIGDSHEASMEIVRLLKPYETPDKPSEE